MRGYSISDGKPVTTLDLSYDDPAGAYFAAEASLVVRSASGIRPLQVELNTGYAKRLRSGLTLDAGVVHTAYSHFSTAPGRSYTEIYIGLAGKTVSSRFSISPDYFRPDEWVAYGELNGGFPIASALDLKAHVGLLTPLRTRGDGSYSHAEVDWRLGLTKSLRKAALHAAFTGRGTSHGLYEQHEGGGYGRNALIVGVSYAL